VVNGFVIMVILISQEPEEATTAILIQAKEGGSNGGCPLSRC
jgi:hypothetical protein